MGLQFAEQSLYSGPELEKANNADSIKSTPVLALAKVVIRFKASNPRATGQSGGRFRRSSLPIVDLFRLSSHGPLD